MSGAYYFCDGCPLGYSAIGGQTLNPYGRRKFETGGSSSGSGVAVATNYAVAAIGTETSGSILSPSGKNSVVGLKPTIGVLSRTGIVPISSTLDTPGPMTKNVKDNLILLSALIGIDHDDSSTKGNPVYPNYLANKSAADLTKLRLGVNNSFLEADSIYRITVEKLDKAGATLVYFDPPDIQFDGFLSLLNMDMKKDLPAYLKEHASDSIKLSGIKDIIEFNLQDTLLRIPYGQGRFEHIMLDSTSDEELITIKAELEDSGRTYFTIMDDQNLDAVLAIDNWNASVAAVAKYPCLGVPMGYKDSGEPTNLTFIGRPFSELKLLQMGLAFEQLIKARKIPSGYEL